MKGERLYNLIDTPLETAGEQGQRSVFQERQKDKIAIRFYYYGTMNRFGFTKCLEELENEFDLTHRTIIDKLGERQELLQELKATAPTPKDLSRKYPYLNWSVMTVR